MPSCSSQAPTLIYDIHFFFIIKEQAQPQIKIPRARNRESEMLYVYILNIMDVDMASGFILWK